MENNLNLLKKLIYLKNNLSKSINDFNELDSSNEMIVETNVEKALKIRTKVLALDEGEDKEKRFKQYKCYWPKCRFSTRNKTYYDPHISHHLNRRQFKCDQCFRSFNNNNNSLLVKTTCVLQHSTNYKLFYKYIILIY